MESQQSRPGRAPILSGVGVNMRFGGLKALDDVNFDVGEGEILGVIGPNGAGKTTLLNIVSGFLAPTSGEVRYDGASIAEVPPHRLAKKGLVRSFQDGQTFPTLTVRETLTVAALNHDSLSVARRSVAEVIDDLGLGSRAGLRQDQLSLPDRKLLEIAKCMVMRPRVMLLDEVMAGLTLAEAEEPMGLIERLHDDGVTVVLIEHVMPIVTRLADRLLVLDFGRCLASGPPDEVLADEQVRASYLGVSGAQN